MKKSVRDYAIYFFTLILGVAVFYIFNSIENQTVMLNLSKSTREIVSIMREVLSGVSVFVSIILGLLVIYASRFLMKRRNKEFGIYMTLGMSKGKISKIILFETVLIVFISLIVGLAVGIALSQIMSIVVANMFEADMTKFEFVFSSSAMIKTMIYFGIMYVLVMLFSTVQVSRCKLIDLLQANKKSEQIKMKNPYVCIVVFLLSAGLLAYAYYNVTGGINNLDTFDSVILQMVYGAIGTFFVFWSLSGLILKVVMSIKKVYFKNLNSFILRQISSKVNTTVVSMTIICLMLFLTICIFSSAISLNATTKANLQELVPVDIQIQKDLDLSKEEGEKYTKGEIQDSKITIKETLEKLEFHVGENFKDVITFNSYVSKELTLDKILGKKLEQVKEKYPFMVLNAEEKIIKISDYNKVAKLYGIPTYTLNEDEYMVISDYENMIGIFNYGLKEHTSITLRGKEYKPKYEECQYGFVSMSSNHMNVGIVLVPDHAVDETIRESNYLVANYKGADKEARQKIEEKIINLESHPYSKNVTMYAGTKIAIYEGTIGLGAMAVFIGLYLGIIFLISSAAVLALKELSESSDNRERYKMLRKIGVDEKMINRALFRQIGVFFAFPLILAIVHSIFGIQVCDFILQTFGNAKLLPAIITTAIFLVIIYGGYFIITYLCSKNIIKD